MKTYSAFKADFLGGLSSEFRHERIVTVFCRALYGYFILKIISSWSTWTWVVQYHPPRIGPSFLSAMLYFPAAWATQNLDLFCCIAVGVTLAGLFIRPNYFTAIVILWLAVNAYKISFPVANGSDMVMLMLLGFAMPMCSRPRAVKPTWEYAQKSVHNFAVLACRLQILLIYFVSGWDKLLSASWRSGEAIQYVFKLDYLFNPGLAFEDPSGPVLNFCLAWGAIIFELSFPFLVWFKKTRLPALWTGVVFHLAIWIFLSLPDFGLIMIISYLIFLKEEDFGVVRRWVGK